MWAALAAAFLVGLPRAIFGLHYPRWLGWVQDAMVSVFAVSLVVFLALRTGELLSRPQD